MIQPELPFGLSVGVQLSNTLIPWGVPFSEITQYGNPNVKQRKNSRGFTWPDVTFLDLSGDAKASLWLTGPTNPNAARDAYHLYLSDFHLVFFYVNPIPEPDPENGLRTVFAHMKANFGPASYCYPEYNKSLPSFFWEIGDFRLSCALRGGGDVVGITIRHYTPKHRAELATFDPPNRGARSDFVKWNDIW